MGCRSYSLCSCRLSAAFDTVCHNNLLSNINRSQLPPATARWLSCYLRGRQATTCFRGVRSTYRNVNKVLSCRHRCSASTLRTCRDKHNQLGGYAMLMTQVCGPQDNSCPKSAVTLFTLDGGHTPSQDPPKILIEDSRLPLVQWPYILDTSLSFNKHSNYVAESIQQKQHPQGVGR